MAEEGNTQERRTCGIKGKEVVWKGAHDVPDMEAPVFFGGERVSGRVSPWYSIKGLRLAKIPVAKFAGLRPTMVCLPPRDEYNNT